MGYQQKTVTITKVENGYLVSMNPKGFIAHNADDLKKIVTGALDDLIVELDKPQTETEPTKE